MALEVFLCCCGGLFGGVDGTRRFHVALAGHTHARATLADLASTRRPTLASLFVLWWYLGVPSSSPPSDVVEELATLARLGPLPVCLLFCVHQHAPGQSSASWAGHMPRGPGDLSEATCTEVGGVLVGCVVSVRVRVRGCGCLVWCV